MHNPIKYIVLTKFKYSYKIPFLLQKITFSFKVMLMQDGM